MRYNFSRQFMKILHPDTNFGEAWETICYILLCKEYGYDALMKLNPPDRGIDIFHRKTQRAYQCKSHENGAAATLEPSECIKSLKMALKHRESFNWKPYCFATNANFSGIGFEKILKFAEETDIDKNLIEHLGPEFWDALCVKYPNEINDRFDFRIVATEEQVIEAFKKARYFDKYIKEYQEKINHDDFRLIITNNRTPVEIEIPFSPELSVENYLDVAKGLLGISLDWTNFHDLNTSANPSLSITIDQYAQPFSKKIGGLNLNLGDKLQLWIKIIWRDESEEEGISSEKEIKKYNLFNVICYSRNINFLKRHEITDDLYKLWDSETAKKIKPPQDRRKVTILRKEAILQSMIWEGVKTLKEC